MSQSSTNSRKSMSLPFSALGDCGRMIFRSCSLHTRTHTHTHIYIYIYICCSHRTSTPETLSMPGLVSSKDSRQLIKFRTSSSVIARPSNLRTDRKSCCCRVPLHSHSMQPAQRRFNGNRGCCRQDCHQTPQRAEQALQCLPAALARDGNAVFRNRCESTLPPMMQCSSVDVEIVPYALNSTI